MKRFLAFLAFLIIPFTLRADPWNAAVSKNCGNYIQTYSVTVSSITPTLLVDPAVAILSACIDIFDNSANTVWIGTNTATLQTTGFPILSSKTYTTDGSYTGSVYGLADSAAAGSINARTIYYLKNDAVR